MRSMIAALFVALFFAGTAPAAADASADLAALIEEARAYDVADSPFLSASEGDLAALARLPDVSREADLARREAFAGFVARADAIDREALDAQEQVSHGLFLYMMNRRITAIDFDEARIPFTNDSGFFNQLAYVARASPITTFAEGEAHAARLRALPQHFDQHIANMRRGVDSGFVQPALVVDRVIAILEALQVEDPRRHSLFQAFASLPDTMSADERATLQALGEAAMREGARTAYAELLRFFVEDYRPAARENSIGASDLPNGEAWYATLVRRYTTLPDATPESVHQTGLAEVARIRGEMDAIIAEVGFEGTFDEFLTFLRTDDQFYAETEEELLMHAAFIAKRADGLMPQWFGVLPRLSYGVLPVPAEIAPAYTTGRYWGGDLERGVAGNYMVNTYDLRARPLYELPALTVHEAVPGHHHQIAIAQEIENVPDFRNELYVTAFGEGWALYTERLAEEMGIYRTPYERFGRLSYEMWRACRLVVDTGIHHFGWTREQAEACFLENSALSPANITTEVERYIAWPGQALAYKIGEMTIVRLRAEAEETLGEAFDIRRFHDTVLEDGAMTLAMLEEKIAGWVAEEQAGLDTAPAD